MKACLVAKTIARKGLVLPSDLECRFLRTGLLHVREYLRLATFGVVCFVVSDHLLLSRASL